jgi:hypothetical protein
MRKKLISLLGAFALFTGLAATASSQNLYVSNIQARYDIGAVSTDSYCQNGVAGYNVSFLPYDPNSGVESDPSIWSARIESEKPRGLGALYPGGCLKLCTQIKCVVASTPTSFGIDELTFEIFKFGAGANPLDPASTPPIRTISLYNIGTCAQASGTPAEQTLADSVTGATSFCAAWDGSYNLNGIFGKTNGQFGFRAKVKTNQVSLTAGNISIEQTGAYL